VGAMIDTGDDETGTVIEHSVIRRDDAVRRRAVDAEHVLLVPMQPERAIQGERMRRGALVAIRRHDDDAAQRLQRFLQAPQRRGKDAVVVGDQNDHARRVRAARISGGGTMPSSVSRSNVPPIRGTSRSSRIWLFSSPYTVGTETSIRRNPRRAARI